MIETPFNGLILVVVSGEMTIICASVSLTVSTFKTSSENLAWIAIETCASSSNEAKSSAPEKKVLHSFSISVSSCLRTLKEISNRK